TTPTVPTSPRASWRPWSTRTRSTRTSTCPPRRAPRCSNSPRPSGARSTATSRCPWCTTSRSSTTCRSGCRPPTRPSACSASRPRPASTRCWTKSSHGSTRPSRPARSRYMAQRRRPVYLWAAPFAVLLAVLCVRNRFLFTQKLYEQGDGGANSILIAQAKHFTLLTGNYSREGFHHPGPAYMYVQAAGEFLLRDLLHAVPTAWNAHMLAVFALNCGFAALAVLIGYGWTRSPAGVLVPVALVAAAAVWQPGMLNSDWMPYMYVVPYLVFVLAVASVAAGAVRDVWIVALSGWLLIHGHACFLFFVPLLIACAVALLAWRHGPRAVLARFTSERRIWLPVAVISALFLLPIAVNLALHWPGDFGKYLSYGKSGRAGGHGPSQITHYLLWFWWPHPLAWLVALAGYGAAIATGLLLARDPLRP